LQILVPHSRLRLLKQSLLLMSSLDLGITALCLTLNLVEFHIDYWRRVTTRDNKDQQHEKERREEKEPTTRIQVCWKTRPLMMVGQDDSVIAQYLLGSKTWVGPKGLRSLLFKSEGDGYMLPDFVSREFGFGRELSKAELDKINGER
jgi:hypothetical protein